MATLALSRGLLERIDKLDPAVRKRVHDLAEKCRQMTLVELNHSGAHLETYKNQKDPRAATIRLGDNHRGIVLVPEESEKIVLIDVLTHDKADHWMLHNEFKVNAATGALEIVDLGAIGAAVEATAQTPESGLDTGRQGLYSHRSSKDFRQLGVDEDLVGVLQLLSDEDQLLALLNLLPQGQADALIMLTGSESVETIYSTITGGADPGEVDTSDLGAAVEAPASQGEFHVVADEVELAEMLAKPLATWRTYLHPSQREAAYRRVYNGPARITGGAGTGKTVVAIHRAKALADALDDRSGKPILFTTYTRNLAQAIERELDSLGGSDLLDVVEVLNVDRLAHRVVTEGDSSQPGILSGPALIQAVETAIDNVGAELTASFLLQEWEQVILAQRTESREEYFAANRAGRGTRLDRRARASVWKVVESLTRELAAGNRRTWLQLAVAANGYLDSDPIKPYRHVIVDEAQDLHETQWRLLRAAVEPGPNDMFIVGDSHQRIYDRRSSLNKVGIEIRGRSRKLRINYRTTHEILRWALQVLGEAEFDDLDSGIDSDDFAGYHSFLHGAEPTTAGFSSTAEMIDAAAAQIGNWIADGIEPGDIGVAGRTRNYSSALRSALSKAGIPCHELGKDLKQGEGVALATMHRMKGLEYRCMALLGVSADRVPDAREVTSAAVDPIQHELDLRRERCLLYMACTRARDHLWVGWAGDPSPFIDPVIG